MTESIDRLTTETSKITTIFISILKQVCEQTEWEYGEVWLPKTDKILEISSAWYICSEIMGNQQVSWVQFRYCSEKFILRFGEGLPGRVWETQTSEWIADVSSRAESYFLRDQIAKAFGAKSGFGMPINEGNIQAVFVFFMSKIKKQDPELIATTATIITHFKPLLLLENN